MNLQRRTAIQAGLLGAAGMAVALDGLKITQASTTLLNGHAQLDVPGFRHRTARVNGIGVHYVTAGAGPAVLLLHGWPFTWFTWHQIIPTLARDYTVIAPDMRGIGNTDKPGTGYDTHTLALDAAALLAHLQVPAAHVVGHDLGVGVAYHLAVLRPQVVRKLVVMESIILGGPDAELFMNTPPWWVAFHNVPGLPESVLVGREGAYLDWFYTELSHAQRGISKQSRDVQVSGYLGKEALRGGFEHYRAFGTTTKQGQHASATRLPMPVLALGGELVGDILHRQMAGLAINVTGGVVERCGHIIQEERPDELLRRLASFF